MNSNNPPIRIHCDLLYLTVSPFPQCVCNACVFIHAFVCFLTLVSEKLCANKVELKQKAKIKIIQRRIKLSNKRKDKQKRNATKQGLPKKKRENKK